MLTESDLYNGFPATEVLDRLILANPAVACGLFGETRPDQSVLLDGGVGYEAEFFGYGKRWVSRH